MLKFWAIFKREYEQVVKKKSFIIGLFLTPALMAAFAIVPNMLAKTDAKETEIVYVLDQSGVGLGENFTKALSEYKLTGTETSYYSVARTWVIDQADEATYQAVLDSINLDINNKTAKYAIVMRSNPEASDSNLFLITNSENFQTVDRFERELSTILSTNRLESSNINLSVDSVLSLTRQLSLTLRDTKGESIPFRIKYFGAFIMVMVMFSMIITYGTTVMRSVIEEKNSRVMEVLISSVTPFQLMLGKVLGLGAATFTSVAAWIVMGLALYLGSGAMAMEMDPSITRLVFNPLVVVFFSLFLIVGYILYSTIFALIGSIVPSEKEAQSFIFPITMSMMVPVFFMVHTVQEPNSTLSTVLSFIPFFSPTMMMARVCFVAPTATSYSFTSGILMEASLAVILTAATAAGVIWLTGKIFRVGVLMYGKRPTLPEIVKWVRY